MTKHKCSVQLSQLQSAVTKSYSHTDVHIHRQTDRQSHRQTNRVTERAQPVVPEQVQVLEQQLTVFCFSDCTRLCNPV